MTLALMGSSHGEIEPRKATYVVAGRNIKNPTRLEPNPAAEHPTSCMSPGVPVVEMATPKGTQQSNRGNEEKLAVGLGEGRTPSRSDERRNPHS